MEIKVKGKSKETKKTTINDEGFPVREESTMAVREERVVNTKPLAKVEAERTEPSPFLKARINKMSQEQKETAIKFMVQRNEARISASMEPAYTQRDIDLYK